MFFNELDLLEIRLETLNPYVDYFVISECDSTFSGVDKPYVFEKHKDKFAKFADKIIHVKNHNSKEYVNLSNTYTGKKYDIYNKIIEIHNDHKPEYGHGQPHWCRDYIHREYIKLGMSDCLDDDIVMFSDLDEIPNPEVLKNIRNLDMNKQYCLLQDNNNYYVNNIASTNWRGNIICKYSHLKDKSLNMMRHLSRQDELNFVFIENAGWHLSFMGPPERIKIKLKSYSHQEFNNSFYINNIENNMNNNKDVLGRNGYNTFNSNLEKFYFDNLKTVKMDGYFPPLMIKIIEEKFPYLIKKTATPKVK
jgi:beta-1,4-mannosyl-glycoprotein beta-1,4-N-acetylglucosaminyltransferase